MCIRRLTMQEWWQKFQDILNTSNIKVLMKAIYVDDSRIVVEILDKGFIFDNQKGQFKYSDDPED